MRQESIRLEKTKAVTDVAGTHILNISVELNTSSVVQGFEAPRSYTKVTIISNHEPWNLPNTLWLLAVRIWDNHKAYGLALA